MLRTYPCHAKAALSCPVLPCLDSTNSTVQVVGRTGAGDPPPQTGGMNIIIGTAGTDGGATPDRPRLAPLHVDPC